MTTRVRVSILAIAFAVTTTLPSIAAAQTPVTFGVKAGVNIAKVSTDDDSDNDDIKSLIGAVGGVFLGKAINDKVGLRLEGLFSQKGAKDAETGDDLKLKMTYVDVPLLLTLGSSSSGFNVFTGPQMSFNTKAEVEADGGSVDVDDEFKSTDFGWVLGVGMERGRVTADARYTLGLSNIAESGGEVKNRVFSVMIGIKLK